MRVFLGLGSNVGDRLKFIGDAIDRISRLPGVEFLKKASIYETEPWGDIKNQNLFLNTVIEIETSLPAEILHKELKLIEMNLGREKKEKWAQREIDIDLLFYGDVIIDNGSLKIPHHQVENRKFVLIPLAELDQDFTHPVLKKDISVLLRETPDDLGVFKYEPEVSKENENVQEKLGE